MPIPKTMASAMYKADHHEASLSENSFGSRFLLHGRSTIARSTTRITAMPTIVASQTHQGASMSGILFSGYGGRLEKRARQEPEVSPIHEHHGVDRRTGNAPLRSVVTAPSRRDTPLPNCRKHEAEKISARVQHRGLSCHRCGVRRTTVPDIFLLLDSEPGLTVCVPGPRVPHSS